MHLMRGDIMLSFSRVQDDTHALKVRPEPSTAWNGVDQIRMSVDDSAQVENHVASPK